MDEQNKNLTAEEQAAKEPEVGPISPPVTYATPMKRLWAWVGVVYAVGYALLVAYALAHAGFPIGIGELLIAPVLAGLGGSVILRFREGKGRGGLPVCILLSGAFFALAVWNLIRGLPVLLAQL